MRVWLTSLLFCCGLGAQSLLINAGGPSLPGDTLPVPAIPPYQADQYFSGGVAFFDPAMGAGIWSTLRYAPSFSYDIPIPNGFYNVKLSMLEPNKTGPNQRRFTVTANGVRSDPIDIWAVTGGVNAPYTVVLLAMVGNGHLKLTFVASLSNALVNAIEISPATIFSGIQTVDVQLFTCAPPLSDIACNMVTAVPGN